MFVRIVYEDGSENVLNSTDLVLVKDRKWLRARARPPTYWKRTSLLDCNDVVVFEAALPVFYDLHDDWKAFVAANYEKILNRHPPLRVVEIFRAGALDLLATCG